jgi:hypothetical protein
MKIPLKRGGRAGINGFSLSGLLAKIFNFREIQDSGEAKMRFLPRRRSLVLTLQGLS